MDNIRGNCMLRVSARSSVQLPFPGFFCTGPVTYSLTALWRSIVAHSRGRWRRTKTKSVSLSHMIERHHYKKIG